MVSYIVSMNNKVVLTIGSVVAILIFLIVAYKLTNVATPVMFPEVSKLSATDHLKWSADKKNILVEYSDLQCPACKSFYDLIKANLENTDIPKKVTFVYRHFPLNIHEHGQEAAQAAEAAGQQNKFFEYADVLFNTQDQWGKPGNMTPYFEQVAKDLKLDLEKFKTDKDSPAVKDRINADVVSGNKFQVNATPTFYLNGEKLELSSLSAFDDFKKRLLELK